MADFSYLDSSGIGQIETPFQAPTTLSVAPPKFTPVPQDQGNVDFANLWKTQDTSKPTPLFNDSLDMSQFKGKIAPRSFDADRLVPYKQSGAYKDLGYNPDMPEDKIQAQYDYDQSNWEAAKSSFGDLMHITGQSFVNYFKNYGNTVKSMINLNQQDIMYKDMVPQQDEDAEAARSNLRFKGDVPMHWYNYIPLPGLMKGDVAEELLPQLGFTVGTGAAAAIENLGMSLFTGGAGEPAAAANSASKLYRLISEFTTLGRGAELAKNMYNGPVTGLREGLDWFRLSNAATSEGAMEAAQGFVQHKQKLIQDYIDKNGHAPATGSDDMQKIEQSSHDVANEVLWSNYPILMASNFIQFRNLLAPTLAKRLAENEALRGMSIVNKATDKIASEFAVDTGEHGNMFLHGATHFLKNALSEGMEESAQNFVQGVASDYEQKLYNGKDAKVMDSVFQVGIPDLTSDNGLQQFMGGFVTGSLFHSFGMVGNKLATLGKVVDANGNLSYKDNLLTKLGFGTEEIAKANIKGQLQTVADVLNTEDLKSIFKEEGLADFIKSTQDAQVMNEALKKNDLFNIGNLKSNALVRFLWTGMETGKLDLRLDQLNAFRDLPQEDLNKFLGIDTGALNKQTTGAVIDHILGKAAQVQEIFDAEKDRFTDKESKASQAFRDKDKTHESLEQTLRTKYDIDANESDLRAPLVAKLQEDPENEELKTDISNHLDSLVSRNKAFMNYVAVKEGRKAAVFAAANMDIDSERSSELMRALKDSNPNYFAIDGALSVKDLDEHIEHLTELAKGVQGVDSEKMLETDRKLRDAIKLRDHLRLFYGDENEVHPYGVANSRLSDIGRNKVAASALYNYMHSEEEQTPQQLRNRDKDEKSLQMLLNLEKRNKDNLSLYNRLTTSDQGFDTYSKEETTKTAQTIGKWFQEFINQNKDVTITSTPEQTDDQAQVQSLVQPDSPVDQNTSSPIDQKFDYIKNKTQKGEPLTAEEEQFLQQGAAVNPEIGAFNDKYQASKQTQEPTPAPIEPTVEKLHTTEDHKTPDGYVPEPNLNVKPDEIVETSRIQEHNGTVVTNPNRTIVNEIPKSEFAKVTPQLEGGYTAWKQGFFNYVAQNDLLDRYSGKLVVDSADNYPEDSREHKYLKANPEAAGLVLVITDKVGNDRFSKNYLPNSKGDKIVHSIPNSVAKTNLLGVLKTTKEEIPVEFNQLSQGIFDELTDPRPTSQLVEGISTADYQYTVAEGPVGSTIYYENGMALRNGGLYIKTQGSYIKLLPDYVGNLKTGTGDSIDITSLVGRSFNSFEDARKVSDFLQKMFYTNKEKGGIEFYIQKVNGQFQLNASIKQTGSAIALSPAELVGALKTQRINVDKNSIGQNIDFYLVNNESVIEKYSVPYNDLLKVNTLTNKKAYETAEGVKVLKPVNRYLTLNRSLEDIYNEKQTVVPTQEQAQPEVPQEPIKSKRRKFDTGENTGFEDIDKLLKAKNGVDELTIPMQEEAAWINKRFDNADLAKVKSVIDAGAWGTWSGSGIRLLENAPKGTGYHEAWHHFSQLYLTIPQKIGLYNEVREKISSLKGASNLQVEEHLAEDFRQYVLSGGTKILGTTPQRNSLFRRILEFLKRIFTGKQDLGRLYNTLYQGDLGRYISSHNNAMFGKLNSKITDKNGNELMTNQKSFRFLGHLESLAGQVLAKNNVSPTQFMTGDRDLSINRIKALASQMKIELAKQANALDTEIEEFENKYPGKATPLLETWEDMGKILDNFNTVFLQYYKQSSYNTRTLSSTEASEAIDTDSIESNEASFGGKGWDVAGNEESVLDSASSETKALIKGLSKVQVDQNGNPVRVGGKVQLFRNEQGLNEPVQFVRTVNNIANLLEGSFSYKEMLDKIKDTGNQKRLPELALLAERLPDPNNPLKYPEVKQLASFLKNFSKTYIPVYTLVKLLDGSFLFREETRRSQDLIEKEWGNNFTTISKDSPYVKNGTVVFDENDKPYIIPASNLDFDLQTPQSRKDFLSFLGIQISQRAEGSRKYEEAMQPQKLGFILNSLRQRLRAGQKIMNPVYDLRRSFNTKDGKQILSEKTTINALTQLEAQNSDTIPSMSFRNAEGNMQHGLSENNWLTNNNYWLSRTQNYSQITENPNTQHLNTANNPYIANNLFLNRLFNLDPTSQSYGQRRRVNGEPVTIVIGNYNGYDQEQEGKNNEGHTTTSLNPRDKLIMDINSFMLPGAGAIEIMRTESSGSAFFVRLSDYAEQDGKVQDLPIDPKDIASDPRAPKVLDYFRGAVQDEMSTIVNKFNSPLPEYKKNIGRFTMFDGILSDKTKDAIMKDLDVYRSDLKMDPNIKQQAVDRIYDKYKSVVDSEVGDFLEKEVRDFEKFMVEKDVSMKDVSTSLTQSMSKTDLTTAFVINDFILNSEFAKLFDGNVGFFKAYHKRAKGNTSTGVRASTDDFLKAYLNSTKVNTLSGSLGDTSDVNLNETKTLVYKDDTRRSVYTTGRTSMYKAALRLLNGGKDDEATNRSVDKAYGNMNVADGQGHATLDFYREMRMRVDNWDYKDEVQYQKEVIGFREHNNLYGTTVAEEQRAKDQKFLKDYEGTNSTFPPMKMQYNGALKMQGVFAPVLDKFSIMPLIPSVIKGSVWEERNNKLLREGIGYTKFESGTKKYKYTPQEFYAATDGFSSSLAPIENPYNSATHFSEGLKEQLRTNSDPKDEATWGTQMRKLFLANLYSSGMADEKFRDILNNYIDLMNKVEAQQKSQLYKEFGIKEDGDNLVISDVKNFVKTLQRQVDSRSLNDNIKNFVQYDPATKSFVYPLEVSLNKAQVQDLISGMIFSRLTRLKVNGDMLIQVASSGFESPDFKYTNATAEDNAKYGSNGLPFYEPTYNADGTLGNTKAMRVKIALIKEWTKLLNATHMDGRKMDTLDRLNEALRDDSWRDANRKKITMIGYRIPTQGTNSLEFMEVHEFLPSVAGSIVILPAEIVAKSGSDYDIDKMPIIRPSLTEDGELADQAPDIYEEKMEKIRAKLEDLFKKEKDINSVRQGHDYSDVDRLMDKVAFGYDAEEIEQEVDGLILDNDDIQQLVEQYIRAASNRQGALTNKMIDVYKSVLESPEMFKQLITPNNVDLAKPVAQEIAKMTNMAGFDNKGDAKEFTNTDVLKYRSNGVKFEQLLSGKRDVGIFAKANVMSQLLQQAGMTISKNYTTYEVIKDQVIPFDRQLTQLLFSPEERKTLEASKVSPDGAIHDVIDYSNNRDVSGVYKQEYLSQMINGTVDVAGDPWYMGLRLNDQVKGAFVHMINMGIPLRRAVFFLNHPAIQKYTNAVTLLGNKQKWSLIGDALGIQRGTKSKVLNLIEKIDTGKNVQEGFYFKEAELEKHIKDPSSAKDWYNRQVLAHFLKIDEQGKILRNLQAITSFDTTKYISPVSAQNNLDLRQQVKENKLFDHDATQKIMNHSMISAFNNLDKTISIFEKLMPIGMSKEIVEASAEVMRGFRGDRNQRIRLERTLNNDWIEFIIKNYGDIGGMNFEDYAKDLLVFNGGNQVLATSLTEMKNRVPQLAYFDAFKRLYNNTSEKSPAWRNIELQRGLDNSSEYQNVLIEELTQLTHFQGNEVPGHTFTPAEVLGIRNFFTKLSYLAFQQSGFNKSALFFTDVIPSENLVPTFRQALNNFQNVLAANPQALELIINDFIAKFKEQNPSFVINDDKKSSRESWRGKMYKITDDTPPPGETPNDYGEGGPSENKLDDMINNCN